MRVPGDITDSVMRRHSGKALGAARNRRGGRAVARLTVLTEHEDVLSVEADAGREKVADFDAGANG